MTHKICIIASLCEIIAQAIASETMKVTSKETLRHFKSNNGTLYNKNFLTTLPLKTLKTCKHYNINNRSSQRCIAPTPRKSTKRYYLGGAIIIGSQDKPLTEIMPPKPPAVPNIKIVRVSTHYYLGGASYAPLYV